tara:strand:- start:39228 stop:39893 length:666 start_codon:yes stop_codon:yes gene_type:complete
LFRRYLSIALLVFLFSESAFSEENERLELIYKKITLLEKEIAELRGLIEETAFLQERSQELNQQRYIDIDKRLLDISNRSYQVDDQQAAESNINYSDPEAQEYKKALEFFEASRFSESLSIFRNIIISYPQGNFVADSYFWTAELYLIQNMSEDAKQYYIYVTENFPNHPRVADCLLKLAEIASIEGDDDLSERLFQKIVNEYPESGAKKLAENKLKNLKQ